MICPKCNDIIHRPITVEPCRHIFCLKCIYFLRFEYLLKKSIYCPIDEIKITKLIFCRDPRPVLGRVGIDKIDWTDSDLLGNEVNLLNDEETTNTRLSQFLEEELKLYSEMPSPMVESSYIVPEYGNNPKKNEENLNIFTPTVVNDELNSSLRKINCQLTEIMIQLADIKQDVRELKNRAT